MLEFEYTRLRSDYGVYYSRSGDTFSIVLVWVDDITIFGDTAATNEELVKKLQKKYDVKVIGEPTLLLGIHIERDREKRAVTLSQKRYITKILERTGMSDSKPVYTPMDPNVALVANINENNEKGTGRTSVEYATRIGELLYAAHATRPDILYATTTLAQFTSNPAEEHWTAVKHVFRYLKGTINHGLTYRGDGDPTPELIRYTDADWGSNDHRKSISGYVFTLCGGAVAWSSKKQSRTALSTAEAEYGAATHAVKQVLWHRNLMEELDLPQAKTSILHSDNQAAIAISHNPQFHARTKHIDIDLHFLRDHVQSGILKLEYVPSQDNLADIFTKALPRPSHESLTSRIGVLEQGGVLEVSGVRDIRSR
jgi:Reverse transcriptase (RNA-dependent DNA polymerase)